MPQPKTELYRLQLYRKTPGDLGIEDVASLALAEQVEVHLGVLLKRAFHAERRAIARPVAGRALSESGEVAVTLKMTPLGVQRVRRGRRQHDV